MSHFVLTRVFLNVIILFQANCKEMVKNCSEEDANLTISESCGIHPRLFVRFSSGLRFFEGDYFVTITTFLTC